MLNLDTLTLTGATQDFLYSVDWVAISTAAATVKYGLEIHGVGRLHHSFDRCREDGKGSCRWLIQDLKECRWTKTWLVW